MNVQRLIEKYKKLEGVWDAEGAELARRIFLQDLEQLDEPEKVKVPQFVAEHIEWTKEEDFHLLGAMNRENFDKKLEDWFYTDDNMELFARAWIDGYEVEKEKRYRAKVKCMNSMNGYLARNKNLGTWYFGISGNDKNHCTNHTRKELEDAGFGWVFDCPWVQIEEVKDE